MNLAVAYAENNNHFKAIECLKRAIAVNPNDANAYLNLGVIYAQEGNNEQAVEHLNKAIQLNPGAASAYVNLGVIAGGNKDYDQEITCYKKAIELEPNIEEIYVNLAIAYLAKNDKISALKQVFRLRELKRNDWAARLEDFIHTGRQANP